MKKKVFSVLLAILVVLPCTLFLAACGDSKNNSDNQQQESTELPVGATCEHTTRYVLREVMVNNMDGVARSGKFVCEVCGNEMVDSVEYQDIGMPILNFNGSLEGVSKENKVTVAVNYQSDKVSFDCSATLKVQGTSSAGYPKKNYNIQLYQENGKKHKVELCDGWGAQSKYCLKANWIDYSQARNVVSGKLYGQVVHSRDFDDELSGLVNGGAIDGFPVLIYLNDEYLGLYTLNIPKDKWLFGMDDDADTQAILMGDDWTNSAFLREHVNDDFSNGWDLEYCSTAEREQGTGWVVESFNNLIDFVNHNDGTDFVSGIANYVNLDRCIDAMLYTYVLCAEDNVAKNILWVTYDGVHWTSSVYDLDGTWGLHWSGNSYYEPSFMAEVSPNFGNRLWGKLVQNFSAEIAARYFELRENVLSIPNISGTFNNFFEQIPDYLYQSEAKKWPNVPSRDTNNYQQIINFADEHLQQLDKFFAKNN